MKKFLFLVLACTMMIGLAGFGVAASTFDVNRQFEMEFHATADGYAVEGVQIFLYRDGVALLGNVTTNTYGVATVTAVNQGGDFSVRFVGPEGFLGNDKHLSFVPVELVDTAMLSADGFYEGVIVKQLFLVAVEVEVDEDVEDEEAAEDYEYEQEEVITAVASPVAIAAPVAPPVTTAPVVSTPIVIDTETVAAWPVSLFAFAPAW